MSNPRISTVPATSKLHWTWHWQMPNKLNLLCKYFWHLLSYVKLYFSLSPTICPSYFTHTSISLPALPLTTILTHSATTRCYWPPSYTNILLPHISGTIFFVLLIKLILFNGYKFSIVLQPMQTYGTIFMYYVPCVWWIVRETVPP